MSRLTLAASCLAAATATASAQPADEFRPALDSRGYLGVNGSSVLGHSELSFGLGSLEWGRHPSLAVDDIVSATLVAAIGLQLGPVPLELGASMPFTLTSGTTDQQSTGDAGFHVKTRIAQLGPIGVAAIGSVFAPTGGEHGASPQLLGVVDATFGRLRLAVNAGVRRRTQMGMSDNIAPAGVAAAWAVVPDKIELVGEAFGTIGANHAVDALGGLKFYLARNSYLSLGAGRGITAAASPDFRGMIGIVFEPKPAKRVSVRLEDPIEPAVVVAKTEEPAPELDDGPLTDIDDPCAKHLIECMRERVIVTTTQIVTLDTIEFEFDKAIIRPASYPILDAIVGSLQDNPDVQIVEIRGHTDERGNAAYNLDLSNRRAAAVLAYLSTHGVAADRLTSTGFGDTLPLDRAHTEAAWTKNRRVEFQIRKRAGQLL